MSNQFPTLHIVDHPLVQHKLSVMRDKNTREVYKRQHRPSRRVPAVTGQSSAAASRRASGHSSARST